MFAHVKRRDWAVFSTESLAVLVIVTRTAFGCPGCPFKLPVQVARSSCPFVLPIRCEFQSLRFLHCTIYTLLSFYHCFVGGHLSDLALVNLRLSGFPHDLGSDAGIDLREPQGMF